MVKIIAYDRPARSHKHIDLPDELLELIIASVAECDDCSGRSQLASQRSLAACARVCRRWYRLAMYHLYRHPRQLGEEGIFDHFTHTLLDAQWSGGSARPPAAAARRRRAGLASLVRVLDMSGLIHHSTSSRTAQLIGAVKSGLRAFAAPSTSLTPHQGFVTLARCERLEFLNLAYLMKEVEWPIIKRAIRNMPRLSGLVLPSQLMLDSSADLALDLPWPPRLAYLSVGLNFLGSRPEVQVRCGFTWPPTLRHLVVWGHTTPTWLSQFTLLIEPCPTPLASVEVLELLPIPVSLLRSREIELEHLSAVTDTTQDALTLWRTFPGLRSLSVAADICNEDFMHAVLLQPRDSMHLEHLRLLRADAGITFGIETMRAAAGLGANGQVGALHGLRGLWYESRAGRDGVGETVVSSETLQEYDEAFCDAALDADPDCSLPDVGWFRSINLPCAPRTFEYATWDGLHYLSPV